MERHNHEQIADYRRLVAESKRDSLRNEAQLNWLLKLVADEETEDSKPLDDRH